MARRAALGRPRQPPQREGEARDRTAVCERGRNEASRQREGEARELAQQRASEAVTRSVAMVLLPLLLALLLSLGDRSRAGGVATDGAGMTFEVTPSSAADPITSKQFDVSVANAPQGADWLLLETVAGPRFSGLPFWFPLDAQAGSASTVSWWSEYFDRDDRAHDPVDPQHHGAGRAGCGDFRLSLSAWKGRNGTWLANATSSPAIHYNLSYTALRWNVSATARAVPGAVRLLLTPADDASVALAADTRYAWWFRYKYTATSSAGIAQFAEDTTIEMSLEPPIFDLSLSVPDVYFVGIFGTFSKGISKGQPHGASGFVSQRAPLVALSATETAFQPLALVIPYANGTTPPLPPGFKGQSVVLPAIPGDARFGMKFVLTTQRDVATRRKSLVLSPHSMLSAHRSAAAIC
jgi:hypothetical protein